MNISMERDKQKEDKRKVAVHCISPPQGSRNRLYYPVYVLAMYFMLVRK